MTTTASGPHTETVTRTPSPGSRDLQDRHGNNIDPANTRKRGIVLVVGGLAIALLVREIGPLAVYWNPLLVGLVCLAGAAATGARSPLWGAGLVFSFWGAAKILQNTTDLAWTGAFSTVCIGLGGLVGAYLVTRGFAIRVSSVAWPVVFVGVGQYVHSTFGAWQITAYTAGLVALYGVVELVNASRASSKIGASA